MPAAAAIPMPQSQDWTRSGERQVAPHLDGIRRDHVARYEFAVRQLEGLGLHGARVIDIACGVGYGSWIMATRARARVLGIDAFVPAIDYARQHWSAGDPQYPFAATKQDLWCAGTANYLCATAQEVEMPTEQDLAVCFETIEHLTEQDALILLRKLRRSAKLLLASVPNEDEMPFGEGYAFHYRHYTQRQFEALLNAAGWIVEAWFGQLDDRAPVTDCAVGRTLVVRCVAIKNDGEAIDDPALPADKLVDLQHSLKQSYRSGAVWVMSDSTLGTARQMKDGSGSYYLWQPDPTAPFGGRFLGSPVEVDDNMPAIAANSLSVAYGNFRRGYLIANRSGITLIRDNVTAKGTTKFNFRRRVGGGVYNFEAIKLMKFAAS